MRFKTIQLIDTPISHRGLHNDDCPENSLSAFNNAIEHNYAIELDVHLSADEKLMVFHDDNLLRMTGIKQVVENQDFSKSGDIFLKNTREKIPTLPEVLKLVNGKVPLLIEIKNKFLVGRLEKILSETLRTYKGYYAVQSFNPYSLAWFQKNAPTILRGQLSGDFKNDNIPQYRKILLRYLLMNKISKPDFVAYDIDLLPCWAVTRLRNKNMPILAWTVNDKEKLNRAEIYADNIIFEGLSL